MTNSCPHCGGSHPAEARFCPVTGKSLLQDPSSPQPAAPPSIVAYAPTEAASAIEKLLFMKRALQLISQGKFFLRAFAIALQVLAASSVLGGEIVWALGRQLLLDHSTSGTLVRIIFQMLFLYALFIIPFLLVI